MVGDYYSKSCFLGMLYLFIGSNSVITGNDGITSCCNSLIHQFDAKAVSVLDPVRQTAVNICSKEFKTLHQYIRRTDPVYIIISNHPDPGSLRYLMEHNFSALFYISKLRRVMEHRCISGKETLYLLVGSKPPIGKKSGCDPVYTEFPGNGIKVCLLHLHHPF